MNAKSRMVALLTRLLSPLLIDLWAILDGGVLMSDSLSLILLVYIKQKQQTIAALNHLPANMADGDSSFNPPRRPDNVLAAFTSP